MLIKTDDNPTGLGYFLIDQTASGIPVCAGRPLFEADTYTCTHCNAVVVLNPERKRERYRCRGCSHLICDPCAAKRLAGESCKTMQQKIAEQFEAVERQATADAGLPPIILPDMVKGS